MKIYLSVCLLSLSKQVSYRTSCYFKFKLQFVEVATKKVRICKVNLSSVGKIPHFPCHLRENFNSRYYKYIFYFIYIQTASQTEIWCQQENKRERCCDVVTTTGCVRLTEVGGWWRWAEVMCSGGTVALPSYLYCHLSPSQPQPHHIRGHIEQYFQSL